MRVGWAIVCIAAALVAAAPAQAADRSSTPWSSAERLQRALFSAQEELIVGTPARAEQARAAGAPGIPRRAADLAAR